MIKVHFHSMERGNEMMTVMMFFFRGRKKHLNKLSVCGINLVFTLSGRRRWQRLRYGRPAHGKKTRRKCGRAQFSSLCFLVFYGAKFSRTLFTIFKSSMSMWVDMKITGKTTKVQACREGKYFPFSVSFSQENVLGENFDYCLHVNLTVNMQITLSARLAHRNSKQSCGNFFTLCSNLNDSSSWIC